MLSRMIERKRGGRTAALVGVGIAWGTAVFAQAPMRLPAIPVPPALESRLQKQDEELRSQRALIQQLIDQNKKLSQQVDSLAKQQGQGRPPAVVTSTVEQPPRSDTSSEGGAGARDNPADLGRNGVGMTGADGQPPRSDRTAEGGAGARDNPAQTEPRTDKPGPSKIRANVSLGPGWLLESDNEEYQLQIHNETQVEYRGFQQGGMNPAASNFDIPRERFIFSGRLTKPLEYEGSVEAAFGTINLLNAFLNIRTDDRFMVKFGRFKVPFGYEYYAISNADLLQPERSLYGTNFGFNRMPGAMVWGQLFDKRLDYAVGAFDGPRNQQLDFNSDKDLIAYLNARPFLKTENENLAFLKYLNFGGSLDTGNQNNPVVPQTLRTSVSQSTNVNLANVAPGWLSFNNNIREYGYRTEWSLHAAYYYKRLSLYGEWQSGSTDYARTDSTVKTHLPVQGFYAAGGFFLTGEEVDRRSQVKPKHPFDFRKGKFGLGAFELEGRYSLLTLGQQVFTAGLADPNLWSNRAETIDVGLNWYLNEYVKVYIDWQHSEFGQPVEFRPGGFQKTSDLFWLRGQIYF